MVEEKRKGSRSIKDIPNDIFEKLNGGEIETANLVEWLAVDQKLLLKNILEKQNRSRYLSPILQAINALKKQTVNTVNEGIGKGLFYESNTAKDFEFLVTLKNHPSDCVRCWATYTIAHNTDLNLAQIFAQIQSLAADTHFGVREIAWLAIRPILSKNLEKSFEILSQWTSNPDPNVRRFASEATRPRGVWCEHIEVLKENPSLGLCILEPLKSDPSKYVQDSVANWLNDASKTQATFVKEICEKWTKESPSKETAYICKRALRTLEK
jgi:3-methyladenine DNA glycosylase AlkC